MSQVTTVRAVSKEEDPKCTHCGALRSGHSIEPPYDADNCPGFCYVPKQPELAQKIAPKPNWERRPWLYYGKQKLESMSMRQLRGAVHGVARSRAKELPRERDEKVKVNKAALIDVALATALEIILDSHTRGVSLYPR